MKRIVCIILAVCIILSCFTVVGMIANVQAFADYSQGFPTKDGFYTVVFTSNKGWQDVNIYSWNSTTDVPAIAWPGAVMEYALTNDYGEEQYIAFVPDDCDRIIFNNGAGEQTLDINLYGNSAYYLVGDYSFYSTGTFDVTFISQELPTEPVVEDTKPVDKEEPQIVLDSSVLKMEAGDTTKISVSNSNGKTVKYSSTDKTIAKIDSKGNITALKKGTVKVTAKVGTKTLKKTVKVINNPTVKKGKKVVKNNAVISVGKGSKLTLTITGKVAKINNSIKIKSSKIAKITSQSSQSKVVVKGVKKGSTTLTVKINGVKTYKLKINVK